MQGALYHLLSCDIDWDMLINALHVPPDAGPYAPALERILRRIPDGWGRWISHNAGWYQIVAILDERLAAIDPDYVVHQVKEKFGTLRYYCAPSGELSPAQRDTFEHITHEAERASSWRRMPRVGCFRHPPPPSRHDAPRTLTARSLVSLRWWWGQALVRALTALDPVPPSVLHWIVTGSWPAPVQLRFDVSFQEWVASTRLVPDTTPGP